MQDLFTIFDSAVICIFSPYYPDFDDLSDLLIPITGLEFTNEKLIEIRENYNAER